MPAVFNLIASWRVQPRRPKLDREFPECATFYDWRLTELHLLLPEFGRHHAFQEATEDGHSLAVEARDWLRSLLTDSKFWLLGFQAHQLVQQLVGELLLEPHQLLQPPRECLSPFEGRWLVDSPTIALEEYVLPHRSPEELRRNAADPSLLQHCTRQLLGTEGVIAHAPWSAADELANAAALCYRLGLI